MAGMGCQRCHGIKFVDIYHNDSVCECPSRLITREKLETLKNILKLGMSKELVMVKKVELEALIDFCEEQLDRRESE